MLQKGKKYNELLAAVNEYQESRAKEKAVNCIDANLSISETPANVDNYGKTYAEFIEKWLPTHSLKKNFSPTSYENYRCLLDTHILPYFGSRIMSSIDSEEIDVFLAFLSKKPVSGTHNSNKDIENRPTLSSSTIRKCYNVLVEGFPVAKRWKYVHEVPETTAPTEKYAKRKFWLPDRMSAELNAMKGHELLHLAVHLAYICSLRAGETAGLEISSINLYERSILIKQQIQRVTLKALEHTPHEQVIRTYPTQGTCKETKSVLIAKPPKTEGSYRKIYITTQLMYEIADRLRRIENNKKSLGAKYHDYGLFICHSDGSPFDPKSLNKMFKAWQKENGIPKDEMIEFQGLRKSGQMHKLRLTNYNYQVVCEAAGGQSQQVAMKHYDETLEIEKRNLATLVENDFYHRSIQAPIANMETVANTETVCEVDSIANILRSNPVLCMQVLQSVTGCAQ